jgi:hypothetical protein
MRRYQFVWSGYQPRAFYFELVQAARRLLLRSVVMRVSCFRRLPTLHFC